MNARALLPPLMASVFLLISFAARSSSPNIVLIMADDMGWGDVGYHGSEIRTPALDQLAGEGVVLERYYAQPTCSPTRAALMTGQSNLRLGVVQPIDKNMQGSLPLNVKILPQFLRAANYQTWLVGKWHLGHARREQLPMARGFDHAYGNLLGGVGYWDHVHGGGLDWHRNGEALREGGYATHLLTDEALKLLDERDASRPFFLYLSYNAPHLPNEAPAETIAGYGFIENPNRRIHAAMIEEMDRGVSRVLRHLEELRLRDDTLIVFLSDNGGLIPGAASPGLERLLATLDFFFDSPYPFAALEFIRSNVRDGGSNNGDFRNGKGTIYEGGVRVPALFSWPGTLGTGRVSQRVTVMDILPTILELASLPAVQEQPVDGVSQVPRLRGTGEVNAPDYVTVGYGGSEAYYHGDWKLLQGISDDAQLFHLKDDPTESRDVAAEQPELVRNLQARLRAYPRGPSVHSTSLWSIFLDPDKFGGEEDRPPWVEVVRD